jgi:hypothetical protein
MKFNDRYFEELGTSAGVTKLVEGKAESIANRARSTAPVDTGEYRDGIEVETKRARYRNVALVVGTDPKTLLVEAKTANLLRALRAERDT